MEIKDLYWLRIYKMRLDFEIKRLEKSLSKFQQGKVDLTGLHILKQEMSLCIDYLSSNKEDDHVPF